jgi:photosystem II stability/assembly factor-like uncharacterized protein
MKKLLRYCGLVALSGAALYLPNCDDGGPRPAPYTGPWKIVACPEGPSYLKGVFFLNPSLGYAVGCEYVLKYDGVNWKVDYVCEGAALEDVWFNSPDDGWVCGWEHEGALLLRYDGRRWTRINHGTAAGGFYALHFLSPNEGWAAGFGICRWNGSSWEYVSDLTYLTDIFFCSPTDGWAVSKNAERIYHYDGTTWTRVHDDPWGLELYSVWFTSPDHGWAGGSEANAIDESNIMEYKNGKWRYYLEPPWEEGIKRDVYGLHFSDPNNGWAVGQTTYRWDGDNWVHVKPPRRRGMIYDVFTISENDAWAVGDGRTIFHYER